MTSIFWFRRDVRLDDNAGLNAALAASEVVPLFVLDPALFDRVSTRRRNLLLAGLTDLDRRIREHGGRLRVERGDPRQVVPKVAADVKAEAVHVLREVTPYGVRRDVAVAHAVELIDHNGIYVHSPGSVLTNDGTTYRVFTPFHRKWSVLDRSPATLTDNPRFTDNPGDGVPRNEQPTLEAGPTGAVSRLKRFLEVVDDYSDERDRIDLDTTSHISVDLKYGWIGARRLAAEVGTGSKGRAAFVRQLAWRDFYGHLMAEFPTMVDTSIDERFRDMKWENDRDAIEAWKTGQTGYPLVDASMRRLVAEGRMHNRARLIVASFLVKDLLVDWRIGERFFRHHLVDGDVSQNSGNWQWVAGTGTDAAPYFRVFNPVTQSKKFDPAGRFIRSWIPELAEVPDEWIHEPWTAGPLELLSYGVELGKTYPWPVVDHNVARASAISTYEAAAGSR